MPARKKSAAKRATSKRGTARTSRSTTTRRATAQPTGETMSAKAAAIEYLRKHRGQQPVKAVIAHVLDNPRVTGLKGATPEATTAAQIYVEAKKPDGRIEKVGRGTVQYRGE